MGANTGGRSIDRREHWKDGVMKTDKAISYKELTVALWYLAEQ